MADLAQLITQLGQQARTAARTLAGTAPARIDAAPPTEGDILLFHDHNATTVRALDSKLPQWQANGRQFVPLHRPVA